MTTRMLYRCAAVLMLLFDLGHSIGYPWSDPGWGVDLSVIRSSHFEVLGFSRTYWDFYVGFGLFVSVFLLVAAVLAWELGSLPSRSLLRITRSVFALCFAAITILSCMYFFTIPIVMSGLITLCLAVAAWRPRKAA